VRIAMYTDSFYPELGGIQDSVLATAHALGERGHQVMIHAPRAAPGDFRIAGLPESEICLGENVQVCRHFSIKAPSSTGQSRLLMPTGRRWRALRPFRPDIIHTHTFLGAGWEALRAAKRLRLPIVGTNHWAIGEFSAYMPLPAAFFARVSVRAVTGYYNRCSVVSAPSLSVIEEMQAFGLQRPGRVVSNPIDTTLFHPVEATQRLRLKQRFGFSGATILYAGRLAVEKNIDILIRALPEILTTIPDAMLALAGHGSARADLESLARESGVADRVRFLGTLDKPALADAYRAADVFAIASTSETQSMVLLQAMSCGLPAVGARWRALPEYLDADCGRLAEPGNPAAFAAALTELLGDPAKRARLGENAARSARRFAIPDVVSAWETLYSRTIKQYSSSIQDEIGVSN